MIGESSLLSSPTSHRYGAWRSYGCRIVFVLASFACTSIPVSESFAVTVDRRRTSPARTTAPTRASALGGGIVPGSRTGAAGSGAAAPVTTGRTNTRLMSRKSGVASPEELKAFVERAGDRLVIVDTRNPDAAKEPGDQKSLAVAPLPGSDVRPKAVHLVWDRDTASMPLPPTDDKDTPIITHCGGGGRGQLAKEFLESKGFTTVINGGGPKETDCWAEFGTK